MSVFEKSRFEIWNALQHPYRHSLSEFAYINSAFPWVTNLESFLDSLVAVVYPYTKDPVATPADLPTGVDTPNVGDLPPDNLDYRVVMDDGDGKAAGYRWEQREGEVSPSWHKIYDMDWGEDSVLSRFLDATLDVYVSKKGIDDRDANGDPLTGDLAGQYIYGGATANSHLTLYANSGDGVGPQTGFIQMGDQVRPLTDAAIDLGTALKQFKDLYLSGDMRAANVYLTNMSFVGDQLTSDTGQINFDNETLLTTGLVDAGILETQSFIEMAEIATPANAQAGYNRLYFKADGKLYRLDEAGVETLVGLEFASTNDNRLVKSDGTDGSAIQESGITVSDLDEITGVTSMAVGNMLLAGNTLSTTDLNGNLSLTPNGTGTVVVPSLRLTAFTENAVYTPDASGNMTARGVLVNGSDEISGATRLQVDDLVLDGVTIVGQALNTDIEITPNGTGRVVMPTIVPNSATEDLGAGTGTERYRNLYLSNAITDGTLNFLVSELMKLRDASSGANDGDSLFYDTATSRWLASHPDSEIDHGELLGSSLLDDDHTQYALLAGRATGQSLIGGTGASENLTFESTSNATKGNMVFKDSLRPENLPATNTTDLGTNVYPFRDLYTHGELKGARLENFDNGTLPLSNAANVGRVVFNTETNQLMIDNGSQWLTEGKNKHVIDLAFNGTDTTKDVTVSADIVDARNCIIQLLNNNNDFTRIYCDIQAVTVTTSFDTIRITTNAPLPANTYRLVVIE